MKPFRYERAEDQAAAVATLVAEPGGAFLAGGTNLVDLMKVGVAEPDVLVDVRQVTSDAIEDLADGGLRIGAAVTNSHLSADRRVRERYPVLSEALLSGASGQLRNAATVGGNLLQRTRCTYFYDTTTPCNKRQPGAGCSAIGGFTRYHAILGASESCIATNPSDMAVALAALDARVLVLGRDGERSIPLGEFHRQPGDTPDRDTVLAHGDLITAVDLLPLTFGRRSRYHKVRDRASHAFALISIAAALDLADGIIREARIALGGVAHKPWRATQAETSLQGAPATKEAFLRAADAELAAAEPVAGNEFKVPLVRNTFTFVLRELAGRGTR
jgi:xanthine dehydrogenase YagS FAD-binding subunit